MANKEHRQFDINIYSLRNKAYDYQFKLGNSFFESFENALAQKGEFEINAVLTKSITHISVDFNIAGWVELICDRSLEPYKLDLEVKDNIIFKFGETYEELDETIVVIPHGEEKINLSQYVYELICLQIPMKKLHPKFENEDSDEEELVYSSEPIEDQEEEETPTVDPRWEGLNKFMN